MPEHLRSIVNRMRRFVGDRRRAARFAARLPVTVSLDEPNEATAREHALAGHTRDVSATGLAIILPAIRVGGRYLAGEGRTIRVALVLPTSTIRLRAAPVRYERLDDVTDETGYLVGAHITEMSDEDRARFVEYLHKLRKNGR
jgi:c-di-GMP-binding flagellar brake protein YcgR